MARHFLFILILLAGCGGPAEEPAAPLSGEGNEAAAVEVNEVAAEANAASPAPGAAPAEIKIGPAAFRYPAALTPVEAQLSVPPDWARQVPGIKLIPADRAELIGKAECLYGQSGEAARCNAAQEAGIGFAVLDRPYEELAPTLKEPSSRPVTLAGREGVSWTIGAEGEGAEHILLPVPGGTLLIIRQFRATADADSAAIDAVLRSLSIEG